jgi:hypothetical protein
VVYEYLGLQEGKAHANAGPGPLPKSQEGVPAEEETVFNAPKSAYNICIQYNIIYVYNTI